MLPAPPPPETMRRKSLSSVLAVLASLAILVGSIAGAVAAVALQDRNLMIAIMAPGLLSFAFIALSIVATFGYVVSERPYPQGKTGPLGAGSFSFSTNEIFARFIVREFIK